MEELYRQTINKAYEAFNKRDIDAVISLMHPDVHWPNGWEGGYVTGHNEVKSYWQRQWKELNPRVEPVSVKENNNGQVEVEVHQVVKDMGGNLLVDGTIMHIYTFENNLIVKMEIRDAEGL